MLLMLKLLVFILWLFSVLISLVVSGPVVALAWVTLSVALVLLCHVLASVGRRRARTRERMRRRLAGYV